jgi:aminomethyltransferase
VGSPWPDLTDGLKRTALHANHAALGARMTEFGGWDMPVRYGSIIVEHQAVRSTVGIFDLSHMGEIHVKGPGAVDGLAGALVNDVRRLALGRAQYTLMCQPDGGVIDDLIVYRMGEQDYLVVPNASNAETVAAELRMRLDEFDVELDDATLRTSLIAIQGPRSREILAPLVDIDLGDLRFYAGTNGHFVDRRAFIARTGYTGEDGFELFVPWDDGPAVWETLLAAGGGDAVVPAGLGARDTLRLEAGMPLYGNELDRDHSPIAAQLGRFVRLDADRKFVGRDALISLADRAPEHVLVGLMLRSPGIARHGYAIRNGADEVGVVTSGSHSPTLGSAIAMAWLRPDSALPGTMLDVIVREAPVAAEVVSLPFYKRAS